MKNYLELEQSLRTKGMGSYFQNPEMLVVSNTRPALPGSNCFWVTTKNEEWYLGTWLPAVYQVSKGSDLCAVCEAVLNSASKAIYTVNDVLALKLNLRRLTESEIEQLGFGGEQDDDEQI